MAQPLPRTLQPPPELPGDDTLSDKLTQYLRTFSLWCRHGFADKLSISTATPGINLLAYNAPTGTLPTVWLLQVGQGGGLFVTPVTPGSGDLGTPMVPYLNGSAGGSNASAGQIGEYIIASTASVGVASNTYTNVASIVLSPGDWDVSGRLNLVPTAGSTNMQGGFTTTSGGSSQELVLSSTATVAFFATAVPTKRYNVTVSTTVYLVGFCIFGSGTATASGNIQARRMR